MYDVNIFRNRGFKILIFSHNRSLINDDHISFFFILKVRKKSFKK